MTLRASKPAFNVREKLTELGRRFGLKGSELAAAETAQDARDLISAGRKNIMINGALEINQRDFSSRVYSSPSNGVYNVDRFSIDWSLNGQMTVTLEDDAPTGFNKSIKFTVNTVSTDNLAQSEYNTLKYNVEAYDTNHLAYGTPDAKPITLSFWVKANHSGKYSAGFRSYAVGQTRGNHQSYRINSPNTWEYKTLTFPGDTEYALPNNNSRSLQLHMAVTNGDTIDDPSDDGNWNTGNYIGLLSESTMDNFNSRAGNTIQWTGFQLEVGKNATEFEHRPRGEELALCKRYYQVWKTSDSDFNGYEAATNSHNSAGQAYSTFVATGSVNDSDDAQVMMRLSVEMRDAPSAELVDARITNGPSFYNNTTTIQINNSSRDTFSAFVDNGGSMTGGDGAQIILKGPTAYLSLDAEL